MYSGQHYSRTLKVFLMLVCLCVKFVPPPVFSCANSHGFCRDRVWRAWFTCSVVVNDMLPVHNITIKQENMCFSEQRAEKHIRPPIGGHSEFRDVRQFRPTFPYFIIGSLKVHHFIISSLTPLIVHHSKVHHFIIST